MSETPNHEYNTPDEGTMNWHEELNDNFEALDTGVEIRDNSGNINDYEAKDGAKFLATDTGEVSLGVGGSWESVGSLNGNGGGGNGDAPEAGRYLVDVAETRHFNAPAEWENEGGTNTNEATGEAATVGGGQDNEATGSEATVGGGRNNTASDVRSTVGGGHQNEANDQYATVAGGGVNKARDFGIAIGGGFLNDANGNFSTISGGEENETDGRYATVGGGGENTAGARSATVGGGEDNEATGEHATVPGGSDNEASGNYSVAAGRGAEAIHEGSFVFVDSNENNPASRNANRFACRFDGGYRFDTDAEDDVGVFLISGSDEWASASDERLKTNMQPLAGVLERIRELDAISYERKESSSGNRSLGFTAQQVQKQFPEVVVREGEYLGLQYARFGVLAVQAIRELAERTDQLAEREERIDELQRDYDELESRLAALESSLD